MCLDCILSIAIIETNEFLFYIQRYAQKMAEEK